MAKARYAPEEVLAEARELFATLDLSDETHLKNLTHKYAGKNYKWYSSACTHFGKKYHDWYGALEKLLADPNDSEEARIIVERVKKVGKKSNVQATLRRNLKYRMNQVEEEFRKIIDGMNFSDDSQLVRLTRNYAQENYDWFSSAVTHFGGEKGNWYVAIGRLLVETKGEEETKVVMKRMREIGKRQRTNASPATKPLYNADEVREEFRKIIQGMDFSEDSQLVRLTHPYAEKNYGWFSSACTQLGKRSGYWYGALEKLLADSKKPEEAKVIVEKARAASLRLSLIVAAAKNCKYSRAQVREKLIEITKGTDYSDKEALKRLVLSYAATNYDWFSSAGTHFGAAQNDWYGALEKFLSESMRKEEAESMIKRIREIGKRMNASPATKPRYIADEVREEFRKIIEGMDFSDNSQLARLTSAYAKKNYDWVSSSGTLFGKKNADWYGAVEKLLAETKGGEAIAIVSRIRKVGVNQRVDANPINKPKYSAEEVREEFRKIIEGMDFSDDSQLVRLTHLYAEKNYGWFSSACTQLGKRPGHWYGAVGRLLSEKTGEEEAKAIIQQVRYKALSARWDDCPNVVLVSSQRIGIGKSMDFSPLVAILSETEGPVLQNGITTTAEMQKIVLSTEGTCTPTAVQKVLFGLGTQDWDSIAKEYGARFNSIAPFIIHHLAVENLLALAKKGLVRWPETILSQASGVSELHIAFQGMEVKIKAAGFPMPKVIDLDLSYAMLHQGVNPLKIRGDMCAMPFAAISMPSIENSSLYQFRRPEVVMNALVEAGRVIMNGGALVLSSANKPFTTGFHSGLRSIGFEPLGKPGEAVGLTEEFLLNISRTLGESFAEKLRERVNGWHILVATKVRERTEFAMDAELFRLSRIPRHIDPLLQDIGRVSRAAFNSSTLQELDAGISAVLELLGQMESSNPKEIWRVFDRIARLERTKLTDFGTEVYDYNREDVCAKSREFLEKIRLKSRTNGKKSMPAETQIRR